MISLSKKSLEPPRTLSRLMQVQWIAGILNAAIALKIFDAVDLGFRSPAEVARECSINQKAAELLLDALAALCLLIKDERGYSTTEEAHYYLVSTSPLYAGTYFQARPMIQEAWKNLAEVARTGKPYSEVNKDEVAQDFFPTLAAGLFSLNYAYGQRLCQHLEIEGKSGKIKVLDLACGSAVWSIPMARCNKNVAVDALDFPVVLETTRRFTESSAVSAQYSYLSGNWQDVALMDDNYDIVILGHILHSEGARKSAQLLSSVHACLKKGGTLVIAEFLVDDARTKPVFGAMFAINMFLVTTDGCVFSRTELDGMLSQCGFSNIRALPLAEGDADVIMADK
jgi:ubiquinone/menaquinone biosynthesis C-methylase UbiE